MGSLRAGRIRIVNSLAEEGSTDWRAIGRRFVACPGFEWAQMRVLRAPYSPSGIVLEFDDGMALFRADGDWGAAPGWVSIDTVIPDARDPGTLGHLLSQARSAHGYPFAVVYRRSLGKMTTARKRWLVQYPRDAGLPSAWTGINEAEAILAAWEAKADE